MSVFDSKNHHSTYWEKVSIDYKETQVQYSRCF